MKRQSFIAAGAAALAVPPSFALAAGPAATVKIGFLESFSGVFSDLGAYHKTGALLALDDANRKSGGRVKYELVVGDDGSKPAIAMTEARRLIAQENVDVLCGGVSSANALALGPLTQELGIFNLSLGPQESSITGSKASRYTYRFGPSLRMLLQPMFHRALALGKKWYFIQADYALGKDAYAQLSAALKRAGGTEVGLDVVKLGTTDFSSVLTKIRNSDADLLLLANSGLDAANTAKQFVDFGLHKRMKLAGIALEDIYYAALPLDAIVGSTFPVLWTPTVSPSASKLTARLQRDIKGPISSRHYLGYMALTTLIDRMNAAGTTRADKLADAFDNHSFEAAKANKSVWHGYDHQCAQDVYAGATVSSKEFAKSQMIFDVVAEVPTAESDGNINSPWAKEAQAVLATQKTTVRENYTPKTF